MTRIPDTRDRDGRRSIGADQQRIRELQTALKRAAKLARAHANVIERSLHAVEDEASLEALCGELLRTIVTELEADSGAFWLCEEDDDLVARIYLAFEQGRIVRGEDSSHPGRDPRPLPEELALHWRQHRYDPVVYQQEDYLASASLEFCRDYYREHEIRTIVTIPLVLGERLFGTCAVRWTRRRLLDEDDLRLATALSMQAALALQLVRFAERAREAALAEERERAAQERAAALGVLNEALQVEVAERRRAEQMAKGQAAIVLRSLDSIREQPSVDAFVEEVVKTIVEQLGGMGAALWVPEQEDGYGRVVLDVDRQGFHRGDSIEHPGRVRRHNVHLEAKHWDTEDPRPDVLDLAFIDTHPSYDEFRSWARRLGIRTVLVVPLIYHSRLTGALSVRFSQERTFSSDELQFTRMLSLHATLAQQLARLGDETRQAAVLREREEAAHRRAADLSLANRILQDALQLLTSEPELDSFLVFVLRSVVERFGAHSSSLQMQNAEGTRIWFQLSWEGGRLHSAEEYAGSPLGRAYEESAGFVLRKAVYEKPEPHFVTDIDSGPTLTPALRNALHGLGVRSLANVPLLIGSRVIGRMIIRFGTVRPVGPDDLQLMQSIANQMALAMQMTRLGNEARETAVLREREEAAHRRAADLGHANRILQEALHLLTSEPELNAFVSYVLRSVVERFGAHSSSLQVLYAEGTRILFLQNWEGGRLHSAEEYADSPLVRAYEQSVNVASVRDTYERPEARVFNVDAGPPWTPELWEALHSMGVRTIANLPLMIGSRVIGRLVIRFDTVRQVGEDDLQLMQSIANQVALAMHLTRLAVEGNRSAVLGERTRMARDIHDTLAQGFTGVIVQLEAAKDAIGLQRAADADAHIERAASLARSSLAEARRSVHALRPLALEHGSLSAALSTMLENMTAGTDIRARVRTEGDAYAIELDWEEGLLRIGQEAMSNALKHGMPRSIDVMLRFSPTEIVLEVHDDGIGFDPNRQSDGMGLTGMQERCASMGGRFELDASPGRGVRVRATLALDLGSGFGAVPRE